MVEGTDNSTNVSVSADVDADRAAFMAGESLDDATEETESGKPAEKPAKGETAEDDDGDLDELELEDEHDEVDADEEGEDDEDPDADLDEEDDEDAPKKKADGKVDPETAKRLEAVRRTDKRLREQREKEWAAREAEIDTRVRAFEQKWKPRVEKAEKIERLLERAAIDPISLFLEAEVPEDQYEYVAQVLYKMAKAKTDPKARAEAAQLLKTREVDAKLAEVTKKLEDRDKADKEREERDRGEREVEKFLRRVTAAASDKTPLAKAYLASDPDEARAQLQVIAYRLAQETGTLPSAKKVMIAFEKDRRKLARAMGLDPKARGTAAAIDSKTKTTPSKGDKKTAPTKPAEGDDDTDPRDEFIRFAGNYDA